MHPIFQFLMWITKRSRRGFEKKKREAKTREKRLFFL